jgi:hypothetical protein
MKKVHNNWSSRPEMRRDSRGYRDNSSSKKSAEDASTKASSKSHRKSGKSRKANPFYIVIRQFKELFEAYDEAEQTIANKRAALNMAISLKKSYYPDRFRFMHELLDEANIILDSKRFNDSCKKLGRDPKAVAENLVLEGKANWMRILKEGLENYGEKVMMFTERIYVDKYNLYTKSDSNANEQSEASQDKA